jgi:hypothetical protein
MATNIQIRNDVNMRAPRKRQRSPVSLEILEEQEASARRQRLEETQQRNEAAQKLPIG